MNNQRPNAETPKPPPGHDKMLDLLGRSLATPKSEIDKREAEWRDMQAAKKATRTQG